MNVSLDVVDGGVGGIVTSEMFVILDPVLEPSGSIGPVGGVIGGEEVSSELERVNISSSSRIISRA